ncbi:MAG: hypothetical protein RL758_187 [Pseudomonadota bacterium]|jgi:hypothetical protein
MNLLAIFVLCFVAAIIPHAALFGLAFVAFTHMMDN